MLLCDDMRQSSIRNMGQLASFYGARYRKSRNVSVEFKDMFCTDQCI